MSYETDFSGASNSSDELHSRVSFEDAVLFGMDVDSESSDSCCLFITALANIGGILCVWLVFMLSLVVCVNGGPEQISFHSSPSLSNKNKNKKHFYYIL